MCLTFWKPIVRGAERGRDRKRELDIESYGKKAQPEESVGSCNRLLSRSDPISAAACVNFLVAYTLFSD